MPKHVPTNEPTVGALLRRLRKSAGFTQAALAERAFVSARTVGDIESGFQRRPRRDTLESLARALEATPAQRAALLASVAAEGGAARRVPLPRYAQPILGRDAEIAALRAIVEKRGHRLVTLLGEPGVGKTRLAVAVAEGIESLPTAFVDLAAIRDPTSALAAVASALGTAGSRDTARAIVDELVQRPALVVIDNCEHVADGLARLGEIVLRAEESVVLATSREPLRLECELRRRIAPLDVEAAVQLFAQRATSRAPDFAMDEATRVSVGMICERLQHLPLAIVLAASQADTFAPAELLARLREPLTVLRAAGRDVPPRHWDMRDALAWSYRQLPDGARRLFDAFGALRGSADVETIAAFAANDDLAHALAILVDRHLVVRDGARETTRYRMPFVIAEFAREKLEASSEGAALREAHARYVLEFVESLAERLRTPADDDAHAERLAAEIDNIRASIEWLRGVGRHEEAARVLNATVRLWRHGGNHAEGWRLYGDARERVRELSRESALLVTVNLAVLEFYFEKYDTVLALCDEVAREPDTARHAEAIARALDLAGTIFAARADFAAAAASYEAARALLEHCRPYRRIVISISYAMHKNQIGEPAAALAAFREAVSVARSVGAEGLSWPGMYALATTLFENDLLDEALPYFERALEGFRRRGHSRFVAVVNNALGYLHFARGEFALARASFETSVDVAREGNHREAFAEGLDGIACVASTAGDDDDVLRLLGAASEIRRSISKRRAPPCIARLVEAVERETVARVESARRERLELAGVALAGAEALNSSAWDEVLARAPVGRERA